MDPLEPPQVAGRMTVVQWLRYYLGGLVALGLIVVAVYYSGAGKFVPPPREIAIAAAYGIAGLSVAAFAFFGLPRDSRRARAWEPVVTIFVTASSCAILVPVFYSAKVAATRSACLHNGKELASSLILYSSDNNEVFPPADGWSALTAIYRTDEPRCPESKALSSYALNRNLAGIDITKIDVPAFTILVFESDSTNRNAAGGKEAFMTRHGDYGLVAYAAGSARMVKPTDPELRWRP